MRKAAFFLFFISLPVFTLAQTIPDTLAFIKLTDGSLYKIFSSGKGTKLNTGNFMEMNLAATYKDSLLFSTYEEAMPQYSLYDTTNFPVPFKEVFSNIRVGDSVILKMPTDSMLARGQAPAFMQNGEYVYQYYVITNVFNTKEQVDSAQNTHAALAKEIAEKKQQEQLTQILDENKGQIAQDSKIIEAWLAKNKLKAVKAKWGSYLIINKPGAGKKLAPGDVVSINYTGRSFSTKKVFDSNTDPAFKHAQPYDVTMGQLGTVILGWMDALGEMQKGTKATVYIPSSLAWGSQGAGTDIKPGEIVVFDMEVINVKRTGEATEKNTVPTKKTPPVKNKAVAKPKTKTPIKKVGK